MHSSTWAKCVRVAVRDRFPWNGRKELARETPRKFSIELKRQIIEELLSGTSSLAQLTRRHEISSGLLYHWEEQYVRGRFNNEPSKEAALEDRVRQLEQLVGRLTLEDEFLKKAVQRGLLSAPKKSEDLLVKIVTCSKPPKGGANS
jgi:transposase